MNKENDIDSLDEFEQVRLEGIRLALQETQKAGINPIYVIIGSLQEYFGGYPLDDKTVDLFFVNEFEKAQFFKLLCDYYLTTINEKSDVELLKVETGHYYVISEKICTVLKSYFTDRDPDWLGHECFKLSHNDDLFKRSLELYPDNEFANLSYNHFQVSFLIGVIIKNKTENKPEIVFANAPHKVKMTIDFLGHILAVTEENLTVNYFFATPHVTRITLTDDFILWKYAEDYIEKIKNDFKRDIVK